MIRQATALILIFGVIFTSCKKHYTDNPIDKDSPPFIYPDAWEYSKHINALVTWAGDTVFFNVNNPAPNISDLKTFKQTIVDSLANLIVENVYLPYGKKILPGIYYWEWYVFPRFYITHQFLETDPEKDTKKRFLYYLKDSTFSRLYYRY